MVAEEQPNSRIEEALQLAIATGQLTGKDREIPEVVELFAAHQKLGSLFGELRDSSGSREEGLERELPSRISHYEIQGQLGVGAFGNVYLGFDTKLQRQVAIKVPRQFLPNEREKVRFLREARTVAALNHPHIVAIHEVGDEQGHLFIVSDYVDGLPLDQWVKVNQLTHHEIARICILIGEAIQYAHHEGVIHRDIKPSNIMIDTMGNPHVMDFGLAKNQADESFSIDGSLMGTPAYMSPEQAKGESESVGKSSDVYSLGVVLFELLSGELPFRGTTQMMLSQVIHDDPPSPRKLRGDVPQDLETITLKCLAKEPYHRYTTLEELSSDLARWSDGRPIDARPAGWGERTWRWSKRNPKLAALTLLVLLGGLLNSSLLVWAFHEREGHEIGKRTGLELIEMRREWEKLPPDLREIMDKWDSLPTETQKELKRRVGDN
ncbi:serine/threonine protein kinase [Planctomycetaceae bacterium]|nr:serine/threonine protein kinase [Planctomycetaceae bacterium]